MLTTERKVLGIFVSFANIRNDRYLGEFDFTRDVPTSEKIKVTLFVSSGLEVGVLVKEFSKYNPVHRAFQDSPPVYIGRSNIDRRILSEDIIFQIPLVDFPEVKDRILNLPGYKIFRRASRGNYVLG